MRRAHLVLGLVTVVVFLGTGQYMDRVHDHLRGMDDVPRMLFRSAHIYLLLAGLLHLALGLYLVPARPGWRRAVQRTGSGLLFLGPPLLLVAFVREPWLEGLQRPHTATAVYAAVAGTLAHLLSRVPSRARSQPHREHRTES